MDRTLIFLSILLSPLVTPPLAADRCSSLRPDAGVAAALTVGVFADPALAAPIVQRAVEAWGVCSSDDPDTPRLEIGRHGTRDLFIEYRPAVIGEDERCGSFQGRTITLFARTRTFQGSVVSCGSLTHNLTHELGHALGLADAPPACSSFAMAKLGPTNGVHRRVRPSECRALSARWVRLPAPPRPSWQTPDAKLRTASRLAYP